MFITCELLQYCSPRCPFIYVLLTGPTYKKMINCTDIIQQEKKDDHAVLLVEKL